MKATLRPSSDRLVLMQEGITHLQQWLRDLIKIGILQFDFETSVFEISSRMVDAKLGAIANRLRQMSLLDRTDPEWVQRITADLAKLFLITLQFSRLDKLSEAEKSGLFAQCGFSIRRENLMQQKGLRDLWLVMGQNKSQVENLQIRKTWLSGVQSARTALILDYAFGRSTFKEKYLVGSLLKGTLVYYPGTFAMRALFKDKTEQKLTDQKPASFKSIEAFLKQYATALSKNLWIENFPCSLSNVRVFPDGEGFALVDQYHKKITISDQERGWNLVALSGGGPIQLFGEWNGRKLYPLSFYDLQKIYALDSDF